MSKVRINDLARELEVKSKAILDVLPKSESPKKRRIPVLSRNTKLRKCALISAHRRAPSGKGPVACPRRSRRNQNQDRSIPHLQAWRCSESIIGKQQAAAATAFRLRPTASAGRAEDLQHRAPVRQPSRRRQRSRAAPPAPAPRCHAFSTGAGPRTRPPPAPVTQRRWQRHSGCKSRHGSCSARPAAPRQRLHRAANGDKAGCASYSAAAQAPVPRRRPIQRQSTAGRPRRA